MTFTYFSNHSDFDYKMHGLLVIRYKILVSDLGFHLLRSLRSRLHIEDICRKTYKFLGFIQKITYEIKPPGSLKTL